MAAWSDPFNFSPFIPGVNEDKLFGRGGEASFSDPNAKPGDFMGLNPRSKNFAQDAFAAITRQQWDDYLTNYLPMENRLIEYASDENMPQENAQLAGRGVGAAFDRSRDSTQRRLAGMGLQQQQQATGMLGDVAAQEAARNAENEQLEAARKQGNQQLGASLGTMAGMAAGAQMGAAGGPWGAMIGGLVGAVAGNLFGVLAVVGLVMWPVLSSAPVA